MSSVATKPREYLTEIETPGRVRWTRDQCEMIVDAGILQGRYELIDGEVISKMGQKLRHQWGIRSLTEWLHRLYSADWVVVDLVAMFNI